RMGDPHHYEKAARYARAAWLGKSAPGPEKLGISYPGVPAGAQRKTPQTALVCGVADLQHWDFSAV
ncbi:hypothetical protein, partial [Sutterella wadsworthensis]|uniref:hypothetical protein n=1 Tax=Sutterella wadsworthensis TaxID=40545 RepID=UPI003AB968AA